MLYKTIVLRLLEQQPELHERLRRNRTLLHRMNQLATELMESHEAWISQLSRLRPERAPSQIASEAMEIAVKELEERFASGSHPSDAEALSEGKAMNSFRPHTPPA